MVSLVLVLYELAGVRLSSLSVFGTNVELTYPESVGWVLRIAWLYCFLCYVQWLRELDTNEYRTRFEEEFFRLLVRPAVRAYMHGDFKEEHAACRTRVDAKPSDKPHRSVLGGWEVPIWFSHECSAPKRHAGSSPVGPSVSEAPLLLAKLKAFLTVLLVTPFFTEYWLPVAVRLAPVALWLVRLTGSLFTLYFAA